MKARRIDVSAVPSSNLLLQHALDVPYFAAGFAPSGIRERLGESATGHASGATNCRAERSNGLAKGVQRMKHEGPRDESAGHDAMRSLSDPTHGQKSHGWRPHRHESHLGGEVIPLLGSPAGKPERHNDGDELATMNLLAIAQVMQDKAGRKPPAEGDVASQSLRADSVQSPEEDSEPQFAQGVLGPIHVGDLGKTSPHEHLLVDMSNWLIPPCHDHDMDMPDLPITLENLGRIRRNGVSNSNNALLDNVDDAIAEILDFKNAGGSTIVEVTNDGFGRNPQGLVRIAQESGLNIIMGSGYYMDATHPPDMDSRSVEECAQEIINDILVGANGSTIKAGIIGEIGCSSGGITRNEEKALRAAALAQVETGAPISVHPPIPFEKHGLKILDILESEGADPRRVIMCHMDHTLKDSGYHKSVAERGCIIEFDRFGNEWYHDTWGHWYEWRDIERLRAVKWLLDNGHEDQVTVAQDICMKINLRKYGGFGYGHLLRTVEPLFERVGIDERLAKKLLIDTPRRLLAFDPPGSKLPSSNAVSHRS
ncbi:hypothetical protein OOZ51_19610 [Arthrobacter sp. MI7-26]|uniref:phosphotriesterase family protein n=1 Tax=Arthrobacter sp. MI7-26 TaxID=2993653 RepID=UPI002248D82E|nr:hypothetical protein [Arthrobacter sp. MI7-26]MCX2749997.1 hypothetical protein [Arthrobacter sp. MI7-26]